MYLIKKGGTMIILFPAIITVILFYYSGKNKNENGVKWGIIGLIGYILGFVLAMVTIGETFISIFIACALVFFTHIQLSKMAKKATRD